MIRRIGIKKVKGMSGLVDLEVYTQFLVDNAQLKCILEWRGKKQY